MTESIAGLSLLGTARPAASLASKADPKLVDGARQFEAMMLQEMLKPLDFGSSPEEGGEHQGGAGESLRGFGMEAMAKAIATRGGFGVAREIIRQVTAEHEAAEQKKGGTKVL